MENKSVTPLETMRLASMGSLVEMPGFGNGDTITVRLRKPNMLALAKMGKIPNELLNEATGLFDGTKKSGKEENIVKRLSDTYTLMTAFCEASLAEPTYKEFTDAGIELTQEQMQFILDYTQGGAKSLKSFREKHGDSENRGDGDTVANTTESAA